MNPTTNSQTLLHIGKMNVLAISGGRMELVNENTISLPVRYGYSVEVQYLPGHDLYEVRRMFRRGTQVKCKGVESHLYADQVGDSAYRASCFRDDFGGE